MKELGEALKLIFSKIAGFFDIFDLSFFVSGIASASAIAFYGLHSGLPLGSLLGSTIGIVISALACYISGLVSFATGRWIRMSFYPFIIRNPKTDNFDARFIRVLKAHGLFDREPFCKYLERHKDLRGTWRLYVRLWAEVRQSEAVHPSLVLLNRYWVMAATYDGIAISMCLWAVVALSLSFGWGVSADLSLGVGITIATFLFLFSAACLREAGRYVHYQIEEIVATIAAARELS